MTSPAIAIDPTLAAPGTDDGFGSLSTPRGGLPLKALEVRSRIDGLFVRTLVRQTFVNPYPDALEATYTFPLPDRAAVSRFRLEVAGRLVEGQLLERGKARETYDQAIRAGQRAAIAEEDRPNVFTMRVGNLPPGETARVELVLTGPLPVDDGEATYRFPLVVAPRYIPGTPLPGDDAGSGTANDTDAVPDASRISPPILLPGQPNPVRLAMSVEVHPAGLHPADFRSSLHDLKTDRVGDAWRFTLTPGERLDRDFVLRFRVAGPTFGTSLTLSPDEGNANEGTFALMLIPPVAAEAPSKPRDVVFVVDRSGSMSGWKMIAARRALGRIIDSLTSADRFAVLAFDDSVETYPSSGLLMAVDRDRYRAQEWLAKIEARGGTELAAPLDQAIRLLASPATPDTDRVLVLLTDGQVGNEDQILKALAKRIKGLRVFTLGIDQAVNDAFLRRLAGLGGGYCEVVESEDRLDAVMAKVHRRIRSPLLSSLSLTAEGVRFIEDESVPRQLPDLFPGAPLTVMGRYAGSPSGSVTLNATDDAGQPWHQAVRGTATANDAIHLSWARARVRELEDRFVSGMGNTATLEKLILATSLTHGVLCRFTAFVAVDVKEVVNEGGEVRRVTQPVELPAGWTMPIDLMAMPMTGALRAGGSGMARCYAPPSVAPAAPALGAFSDAEETVLDSDLAEMPASRSEGIIDRLAEKAKQIFRSRTPRTTAPAGAGIDLSAYRRRVAEMLDQINKATDIVRALGTLAIQLEALIDDLKSIGVSDNQTKPLADLLREFCEWLAKAKATPGIDVASMVERCREVLGAFAKG